MMKVGGAVVCLSVLVASALSLYVPGTPGGAWSESELLAVKSKLYSLYRQVLAPKALRLSFHDCVKYTDGTGGCDGCLNWEGVGQKLYGVNYAKNFSNIEHGNNNGLDRIVQQLERVYTEANYPYDAKMLPQSLKESGKSRADLWSYAAIVAVEYGIESNNLACVEISNPRLLGHSCIVGNDLNTTECFVKPDRPLQFQYGRSDCTDFDPEYPYMARKAEVHPNPVADGKATVKYFKENFDFNGRETAAIFGAHTFGFPKLRNSLFPYTWTSGAVNAFNNDYYKNIVGQDKWFVDDDTCFRVGDAFGNKPKTRWVAHTRKMTERGGPVFWIHQNHVCPSVKNPQFWNRFERKKCMPLAKEGQQCRPDKPAAKGPYVARQPNEPDGNPNRGCERWRLIVGKDEIALNCEMGLYLDFQVTDGVPHGCTGLEHFKEQMASDARSSVWSYIPGQQGWAQPLCGKQTLAEPAGSTPLYMIMEEYANSQTAWINDYTLAFEKMMRNGYPNGLSNGPDIHNNLICPLPILRGGSDSSCYKLDEYDPNGLTYTITSQLSQLSGYVYQYNTETERFDYGSPTGEQNQLWRVSNSGQQLINAMTGEALVVRGVANFVFDHVDDYVVLVDAETDKVVDCWNAHIIGNACIMWNRHNGHNQRFVMTPSM